MVTTPDKARRWVGSDSGKQPGKDTGAAKENGDAPRGEAGTGDGTVDSPRAWRFTVASRERGEQSPNDPRGVSRSKRRVAIQAGRRDPSGGTRQDGREGESRHPLRHPGMRSGRRKEEGRRRPLKSIPGRDPAPVFLACQRALAVFASLRLLCRTSRGERKSVEAPFNLPPGVMSIGEGLEFGWSSRFRIAFNGPDPRTNRQRQPASPERLWLPAGTGLGGLWSADPDSTATE